MRLSELGESGLLAELERRRLVGDIADDAALLPGGIAVTQDALVEDVHFRREWTSWRDLGYKAAAVNLSDLAACGAAPLGLVVSLGLPPDVRLEDVLALYEGLNEPGVKVVGGDTARSERVYLSVTALGRAERVPGRSGARPGDLLVVTGPLGASAAGFLSLRHALGSPLEDAHRRPPLRIGEGIELARRAHAMLDLSDGLAADAGHVAARSGCRCVIELERVPVASGVRELAERLAVDAYELACGFGEDYELLAAVEDAGGLHVVGRCEVGSGVELLRAGSPVALAGWDHFRRPP